MELSRSHLRILVLFLLIITSALANKPSFSVEEGRPANTLILDLSKAKLADFSSSSFAPNCSKVVCTYMLASSSSTAAQYVDVDSQSGRISTKRIFDREALLRALGSPEFDVDFTVTGNGGFAYGSFLLQIGDINDNAPRFAEPIEYLTISEASQPNAKHYISEAKDEDAAENGTVTYAIESGNTNGTFELKIDSITRLPYLTTSKSLDRETTDRYRLNISAHDNGKTLRLSGSHIVYVTLLDTNDNGPRFENRSYAIDLKENSPSGMRVLQVRAHDADAGHNGRITFHLSDVYGNPEPHFVINNETGEIRTTSISFDYETEPLSVYEFFVKATDNPSDARESSFTTDIIVSVHIRDVNDEKPEIEVAKLPGSKQVAPNTWTIQEGYGKGIAIAQVSLTDPDTGPAQGSYVDSHMTGGDGYFEYVPPPTLQNLGEILINKKLDYEDQKEFLLTLVAVDQGVPPLTSSVTLNIMIADVNDNKPQFEKSSYQASVAENQGGGVSLVQVSATDIDTETNLIYGIDSVEPSSLRGAFFINETSGWLLTLSSLDREKASTVRVKVSVSDGKQMAYVNVSITVEDVNDHRPQFGQKSYEFQVSEGEMSTRVGVVKATDMDAGESGAIEYEIKTDNVPFAINKYTGVITTKGALDYESHTEYIITIIALNKDDTVTMQSEVNVTVKVQNVNDNKPRFNTNAAGIFYIKIDKLVNPGDKVFTVSAEDPDKGNGAVIFYQLVPYKGLSFDWLTIRSTTGEIIVAHSLNQLKTGNYTFIVRAEDDGGEESASSVELIVEITGVSSPPNTDGNSGSSSDFGNTLIILIIALVVLVVILVLAALLFVFRRKARDWMLEKDPERGSGGIQTKAIQKKSSSRVQFAEQDFVTVNEYPKEPMQNEPMTPRGVPEGKADTKPPVEATIVPRYSTARSRKPIIETLDKEAEAKSSDGDSNSSKDSKDSGYSVDVNSATTPSVSSTRELLPHGSYGSASENGVIATPL